MRCFDEEYRTLMEVAEKYSIETGVRKLRHIESEATDFKVKILFVGMVSAGKSALLNALLQIDDFLMEGLTPETSVATEIMFGENNVIELHKKEGVTEHKAKKPSDIAGIDTCRKLVCRLNNEFLHANADFVFVDMPGFDSACNGHDKAIASYAAESGNAYILCVNCHDGTIQKSVADGLREIRNYSGNIACVVTRADEQSSERLERIRENVEQAAELFFGEHVPTLTTSNTYALAKPAVSRILAGFNVDRIFRQTFAPELTGVCHTLTNALEQLQKYSSINNEPSAEKEDREIRRLLREKVEANRLFDRKKSRLKGQFASSVKPAVLSDVEKALKRNANALVSAAKTGGDNFSRVANGIIRPVIADSLNTRINAEMSDFIDELCLDIEPDSDGGIDQDRLTARLSEILHGVNNIFMEDQRNSRAANATYKTAIGIAGIATTIVAPWIEIVILFLPEIVSLLSKVIGGSPEDKVVNDIIPQIITQLSPQLDEALKGINDSALSRLEEALLENLSATDEAIAGVERQKLLNKQEYERLVTEYGNDLSKLRKVGEVLLNV